MQTTSNHLRIRNSGILLTSPKKLTSRASSTPTQAATPRQLFASASDTRTRTERKTKKKNRKKWKERRGELIPRLRAAFTFAAGGSRTRLSAEIRRGSSLFSLRPEPVVSRPSAFPPLGRGMTCERERARARVRRGGGRGERAAVTSFTRAAPDLRIAGEHGGDDYTALPP